jgi:hypothetical protein
VQDRFLEPYGFPSLWKLSTGQLDQLQLRLWLRLL